ncbi:MAG: ABC transporter permease [Planctomycetota bacterium]|jgi:NitT/TauT family transport system permease protein/taurine transport system permease protein|nr:ABC transporter permease [Planctomycetota bacterium]
MKRPAFTKFTAASIISVVMFFVIWYALTAGLKLVPQYVMPDPLRVLATFIRKIGGKSPDGATILAHMAASLEVALMGFGAGTLTGVPLGICMAWYRKVDRIARPVFDFLRPIPPIAWIPVMILWLGIGTPAKAAVIYMSALIPNVINSYTGIRQTSQVHIWVGRTFGASDFELLTRVAIPSALPNIFTGLRLSLGTSWVSLVSAEMLASTRGLGYMIQIGRQFSRTDLVLVGMITIGVMGAVLAVVLEKVEKRIVKGRSSYGKK